MSILVDICGKSVFITLRTKNFVRLTNSKNFENFENFVTLRALRSVDYVWNL